MSEHYTHYSKFQVMDEKDHWDDHTQKVVEQRLHTQLFYPYKFLTQQEAETLFHLCAAIVDDERYPIIAYVIHHLDTTLHNDVGESQRKLGVLEQAALIRTGLSLLNGACQSQHNSTFSELKNEVKQQITTELMQGSFPLQDEQVTVATTDFMQKISSESVSAYYSHPDVWSEIGYGGPAYPRGYVRSELGLRDPWEAKRDDTSSKI